MPTPQPICRPCLKCLPTALTWTRIAAIPLLVLIFYSTFFHLQHQQNIAAASLFIFAAITDWLDGYLARRWQAASAFGAFLDPVADKLMVAAALLLLLELGRVSGLVALIIIGREITISALREWMAQMGATQSVAVHSLGKLKTTLQMIAVPMLLWYDPITLFSTKIEIAFLGQVAIIVAALLTVVSMVYYLYQAHKVLRSRL